jgi:hypothetical protein
VPDMSPDVEDSITTNDGVRLRYAVFGREGPAVVMVSLVQCERDTQTPARCVCVACS